MGDFVQLRGTARSPLGIVADSVSESLLVLSITALSLLSLRLTSFRLLVNFVIVASGMIIVVR